MLKILLRRAKVEKLAGLFRINLVREAVKIFVEIEAGEVDYYVESTP